MRDLITDPALLDVRITAVVLSVDYRHARVHFALVRNIDDRLRAERALVRATSFLRTELADAIDMKRVPEIRFVFDAVTPADDD